MKDTFKIRFFPHDKEIAVKEGETLIRAAMEAGVHINASCGGEGVCGKCRVIIESGDCGRRYYRKAQPEGSGSRVSAGLPVSGEERPDCKNSRGILNRCQRFEYAEHPSLYRQNQGNESGRPEGQGPVCSAG